MLVYQLVVINDLLYQILELSSSFDTGLCKIPVDLYSSVRILETSAFFSIFSILHYVGLGIVCFGGCSI